jgi:large subunit ribosomal protein L25
MTKGKLETLEGTVREQSAASSRRQGLVPAVLYGHGLSSKSIEVDAKKFTKVVRAAGFSSLVNLKLSDGSEHAVLIRDVEHHPLKDAIIHADFYQVRMDEKIEAEVPLAFIGEAAAIKNLGGVLIRNLDTVKVSALPTDLPHNIEVDIASLTDFEKVIRVADIQAPSGVTLDHAPDEVVALVQEPRSEQEIEQLAAEVKEDVEAVEGVKKEEPPAEGEEEAKAEDKKE